ncbi:TetR family transcriptional regulator [Streptomyces thermoviolaceus]|uniref:TetR family transcriptional regulator n=1 Tax=Streptomyces TaxID=1883 RepID=UPI000F738852|nr:MULTISPECIES: TetR family transcriptional regulator [Streptomyces]MCM3264243.1 TetR family transcriptional regulator [Streptomyces thermoviolaceus]RSS05455.1 TetR family transcriptional regulator [Streptomyces sp. WAC00469]WTD49398.1 TetR family transcriptional regulator [Streptomyces thermoviolaceus]GGV60924.1 TetR family transcriptional regulator [Streptomyces thermoviolaceus subsp. apingens]
MNTATAAAAPQQAPPPAPRPGLRERKKQRTRDALLRAALELFTARGYEQTTVDDIARAVGVSQRTFFRYFPGKEEVAFAMQDMVEAHFMTSLRARPAHEPPLEALRRAVLDCWDSVREAVASIAPLELYLRMFRTIESTPVLLATHLRRSMEKEEHIAAVLAEREGLDVDADPRPRLVVAAFSGVLRVTGRLWSTGEDLTLDGLRSLTVRYLDQVGPALAGTWRTPKDPNRTDAPAEHTDA